MDMGNTESDTTPVNAEGQGGDQQSTVNFENGLNSGEIRISEAHEVSAVLSEIVDLTKANESTLTQVYTDNYKDSVAQDDMSSLVTASGADISEARANKSSLPEVPGAYIIDATARKSSLQEVADADNSEARANKSSLPEVAGSDNSEDRANKSSLAEVAGSDNSEDRANTSSLPEVPVADISEACAKKSSLPDVAGADNSEARANTSSLSEVPGADNSEASANKSSQSEVAGAYISEARANKSSIPEVAGSDNSEADGECYVQSCHVKGASEVDKSESISTTESPITQISAAASNEYNNHTLKEDGWSFQVKVASFTDICSSSDTTKPEEIRLVEKCPDIDGQVKAEQGDLKGDQAIDASCSTSIKHQQCQPCSFDDEEREASGFCVNCLEYICNDCSRDHRRNKITRDHVVLKGDEMPEDSTQFAKIKDLMKCPLHAENDISFECKDHGNLICVSCFTENHRKCEHVLDIAANEDAKQFMMQAQLNQFEVLKTKCRILAEKKECDKNVLIKERQELEDKGRALAADLREHLAGLEARFEKKLGNLFRFEIFKLLKETDMITEHQRTLDELNRLVATVGRHGSKKEVIIVNKYIQDRLKKCAEELDQSDGKEQRHIKLTQTFDKKKITSLATLTLMNESLEQTQNSSDIFPDACGPDVKHLKKEKEKKEGMHVKKKPNKTNDEVPKEETENKANPTKKVSRKKNKGAGSQGSSKQQTTHIQTNKKSTGNISSYIPRDLEPTEKTSPDPNLFMNKCLEKKSFNIRYKTNVGTCYIIDCTMLSDGQMAFLDYDNKSLKLCSQDFVIKMMLEFNDRPVSICSQSKMDGDTSKIFISFANSKQILHYKVTPTAMTKAGSFSISLYPICIRMVDESLLVLASDRKRHNYSDGLPEDTVVISLRGHNGKLIKEKKLNLSDSKVILVSGSTLISAGRVIAGHHFDPQSDDWIGKQKWVLSTDQLAPYVDVDTNGNVYVCSAYTDVVQQVMVSQIPPFFNRAFLSGVKQATCLFVDSERQRIIVGAKLDEVEVYTF
ncbi:uncharacterized protein LOC127835024 [Dreissena polymorpha]|uniref:B box-type domain-containing protein n=1 Tax=Dreissena polymorpha TaxID=45954 RepID=A0A9D4FY97_DREPO|nr:uncharacterized protein LOC127835024 [Dreissena polymorpha]KAH3807220.1 hypothetical protein DPMN_135555 [Dreissena polymorpha]